MANAWRTFITVPASSPFIPLLLTALSLAALLFFLPCRFSHALSVTGDRAVWDACGESY
jgi:hypothetical protein